MFEYICLGILIGFMLGIPIGMVFEDLFDQFDLRERKKQ